jgi:hypothetical protein
MNALKLALPVWFVCAAAGLAQPAIAVEGINGTSASVTSADLAKLPQQTVQTTDHGKQVTFTGVLLKDVLARVDQPLGEKFHSTGASYYLTVEAADGYRAVYAWAELDPSFTDKLLYVVTARDGHPLDAKEGPFRLVAPGEKRGARWVRQVTALKIQRAN